MSTRYIWLRRLRLAAIAAAAVVGWIALMWLALGAHDDRSVFVDSRTPPDLAERFYPPEGWAWGLIAAGDGPVQRYGVDAPDATPRGQVLILIDYGESAETWFETVRDLEAAGLTVWVLEGVGEGGSARLAGQRDLGELKSFDQDVETARAMIDVVIRPTGEAPLTMLGEGQGALVAARLVETGATPSSLVLSAPRCASGPDRGAVLSALGLGRLRAPGGASWRRDGPDDFAKKRTHDRWRGAVTHRWQLANPDLRLGDPSLDWLWAAQRLQQTVASETDRIKTPTLRLRSAGPDCLSAANAEIVAIPNAGPALELEDDPRRRIWLSAILHFIAAERPGPALPLRSRAVTSLFKPSRRL